MLASGEAGSGDVDAAWAEAGGGGVASVCAQPFPPARPGRAERGLAHRGAGHNCNDGQRQAHKPAASRALLTLLPLRRKPPSRWSLAPSAPLRRRWRRSPRPTCWCMCWTPAAHRQGSSGAAEQLGSRQPAAVCACGSRRWRQAQCTDSARPRAARRRSLCLVDATARACCAGHGTGSGVGCALTRLLQPGTATARLHAWACEAQTLARLLRWLAYGGALTLSARWHVAAGAGAAWRGAARAARAGPWAAGA